MLAGADILPNELFAHVAAYLDGNSVLGGCACVSRHFRALAPRCVTNIRIGRSMPPPWEERLRPCSSLKSLVVDIPAGLLRSGAAEDAEEEEEPSLYPFEEFALDLIKLCKAIECDSLSFDGSGVGLGSLGLGILVAGRGMSSLKLLTLSYGGIGDEGAKLLGQAATSGVFNHLCGLDLRGCMIGRLGCSGLMLNQFPELARIDISENELCKDAGDSAVFSVLIQGLAGKRIERLGLAKTCTWESFDETAMLPEQSQAAELVGRLLSGEQHIDAQMQSPVVEELDFSGNNLLDASSCYFFRHLMGEKSSSSTCALRELRYGRNQLGKSGCLCLASAISTQAALGCCITTLHLERCWSDAAYMCAREKHSGPLTSLIRAITSPALQQSLTDLSVAFNKIAIKEVQAILQRLPCLRRLNLFRCFWFRSTLACALTPIVPSSAASWVVTDEAHKPAVAADSISSISSSISSSGGDSGTPPPPTLTNAQKAAAVAVAAATFAAAAATIDKDSTEQTDGDTPATAKRSIDPRILRKAAKAAAEVVSAAAAGVRVPAGLTELNLGYNQLTHKDMTMLTQHYLGHKQSLCLQRLVLSTNPRIGDSDTLPALLPCADLDLSHVRLSAQSLECLLGDPANHTHVHQRLCHLKLAGNSGLGPRAGAVFAKFCSFDGGCASLASLNMSQCKLKDDGVAALMRAVEAGGLRSLERLVLQRNDIGDATCALVLTMAAKWLLRLRHLCLKHNQIGLPGALAAALTLEEQPPRLLRIRVLSLQSNPLAADVDACAALEAARARRPAMQPGLAW